MALSHCPFWTNFVASAVSLFLSTAIGQGDGPPSPSRSAHGVRGAGSRREWTETGASVVERPHPVKAPHRAKCADSHDFGTSGGADRRGGRGLLREDLLHDPGVVLPLEEARVREDALVKG